MAKYKDVQSFYDWGIVLRQAVNSYDGDFISDDFEVQYGLQKTSGLTYDDASKELGRCIMHGIACEGRLNNGVEG